MSSYSRVVIVISVLYIPTFFSPVFCQNCVLVGEKFNVSFNYNPPKPAVFWLKNGAIFSPAAVESNGSGCKPGGNAQTGFTFYCEDGGATYIMEITSKLSDKNLNFTTDPIVGFLVYTPIVDLTGTDINLDQCPKRLYDCNQPDEKVEDKFTLSCESTCTQDHSLILQYQPESGPVQDLEKHVNPTPMKCNNYADLYKSTFNYIVDSNHAVLGQFNSTTNKVRLIVKIGGRNETVFETIYFYVVSSASSTSTATTITSQSTSKPAVTGDAAGTTETSSTTENTTGSSSGEDCSWCIPVLVPIVVIVFVVFCGCCIYFVICKKKKKEEEEKKKKSDCQAEATELKDPKTQQREGEIEKKQENH